MTSDTQAPIDEQTSTLPVEPSELIGHAGDSALNGAKLPANLDPTPNNFRATAAWLERCGKMPSRDGLSVQVGVLIEEFSEFMKALYIESNTGASSAACQELAAHLDAMGSVLKKGYAKVTIHDHEAALDALCDIDVSGNGVAYMAGYDKAGADLAVISSNWDKLNDDGTPVILEGGKIGKRAGWAPPDLTPFLPKGVDAS